MALGPDRSLAGHFHGTAACLSALFAAGRYEELLELAGAGTIWPYRKWAVKALAAQGRTEEALAYAESCRSPWASDGDIDATCEELLLAAGQAYRATMAAAEHLGNPDEVKQSIRALVATECRGDRFISQVLGRELE
jgi:hypothetical protein